MDFCTNSQPNLYPMNISHEIPRTHSTLRQWSSSIDKPCPCTQRFLSALLLLIRRQTAQHKVSKHLGEGKKASNVNNRHQKKKLWRNRDNPGNKRKCLNQVKLYLTFSKHRSILHLKTLTKYQKKKKLKKESYRYIFQKEKEENGWEEIIKEII